MDPSDDYEFENEYLSMQITRNVVCMNVQELQICTRYHIPEDEASGEVAAAHIRCIESASHHEREYRKIGVT